MKRRVAQAHVPKRVADGSYEGFPQLRSRLPSCQTRWETELLIMGWTGTAELRCQVDCSRLEEGNVRLVEGDLGSIIEQDKESFRRREVEAYVGRHE